MTALTRAVHLGEGVRASGVRPLLPRQPSVPMSSSATIELPHTVPAALELAQELTPVAATLGAGGTLAVWETLATISAHDLGIARAIEPHLDAASILFQSGGAAPEGAWGVYAAEGGPAPLRAVRKHASWVLDGVKPWCSLAQVLDHALITARTEEGERRLFAVDLHHHGVRPATGDWHPRGFVEIPSTSVTFQHVPAQPIGEPDWYLNRPGFWWGAIGVAACWFGGAVGIARTVFAEIPARQNPHSLAHLGVIDALLHACRATLADAATQADNSDGVDGRLLARRVRGLVARSCEEILVRAGHVTGPGPLTTNSRFAKQMADLQLYIRQHHAERDDESHGGLLIARQDLPW